jgi:hypothetical protein
MIKKLNTISFLNLTVNTMMFSSVISISVAIVVLSKHIHDNEAEHTSFIQEIKSNKERIRVLEQEVELYKTGNDI